jgi:hypothetical protein
MSWEAEKPIARPGLLAILFLVLWLWSWQW